jgi:hypothetical protein
MLDVTQVEFTGSVRNVFETDNPPFRAPWVMTPDGSVRPSLIDTAGGATDFRRNKTPLIAEGFGYVRSTDPEDATADILDDGPDYEECEQEVWDEEGELKTELVTFWREEEPFIRPEPVPAPRSVARIVCLSDGQWVVRVELRPARTEKPEEQAEAADAVADASSESVPVRTYGERRALFLVRRNRDGQPYLKKAEIRAPMIRPRPKVQAEPGAPRRCKCGTDFLPPQHAPNAALCRTCHMREMQKRPKRTCKCGAEFRPPVVAPNATLCRDCHKRERDENRRRQEAVRARESKRRACQNMEARIKEAVLRGNPLPEGAEIRQDEGRQVIVLFEGKSYTVYRKSTYGKTARNHQAHRWQRGRAA